MKEAIVDKGPKVTIRHVDIPKPGPRQVVTKIEYSGSNPKDWKIPEWVPDAAPMNQGDDISGIVHEVGEGVTEFKKGDRVAAFHEMMKPGGSYAEYGLSWDHTTFFLPKNTSFEAGAAIPLAALTAALGLFAEDRLNLPQPWSPANESIPLVVYGASSAVGSYVVQFATQANIHPLICVAGRAQSHVEKLIDRSKNVAIIGAGLGGCTLAIALAQKNIPVTVYEARPESTTPGGFSGIASGVLLTPNGLRVLDNLGIYSRIKDRCYVPTHRILKNDQDETTKKVEHGELGPDGFRNHRIWRSLLLDEMRTMLKERGVPVHYGSRFNGFVSENAERGVAFRINDEEQTASLLIGSDGIYSSVRKYVAPTVGPEYTGLMAILSHIPYASVEWPYEDYEKNATIQSKPGAILWIAEDPEGKDLMIGKQFHYPQQSRQDLEALQGDRDKLAGFVQENYEEYGETARKIIDSVVKHKETLYIWPFLKMPKLERWFSEGGRVILVGDGAHAVPPSSGQGVNQALEDVYSITYLLSSLKAGDDATKALAFWQQMRQERIDAVVDWTENSANVVRLPEAERQRLVAEGKVKEGQYDDMSWLHHPNIEQRIDAWMRAA
ncbi:FAD NAD(P)-binding domain-containing [Lecanosticta acicola]|uniref:FAD NAD(P)-binding domain-containing n=1 Tax=Lecanosticta acicola TaxID=111012 RepID=A0AAI8YZQ3_9PEZI|nr:FAD NAD(P)-binding domain-containing [Lecanosticta acicola]